jgi:hypothetical protein
MEHINERSIKPVVYVINVVVLVTTIVTPMMMKLFFKANKEMKTNA